ncbi:hypothetical protein SDC49_06135 [Lactobacillus sp. R2/2]|nr:hypothetical protein [Lactobacillus sp. R2/2]
MTFNEINNLIDTDNPFNAWTGAGVLYKEDENQEQTMYQISHYQFLASSLAVQEAKKIDSKLQIGCMLHLGPYILQVVSHLIKLQVLKQWIGASSLVMFKLGDLSFIYKKTVGT